MPSPTRQERAVRRLWKSQLRAGGVSAVYRRGNDVCELQAVLGQHRPELYGSGAERLSVDESDWLVAVDSLVIASQLVVPERGDKITVDGEVHEVVNRGEAGPFRYTDQHKVIFRIFTILTGDSSE